VKSEMKCCSIEDDALIKSCWEIRVLIREQKGVIFEFENWGGEKWVGDAKFVKCGGNFVL